MLCIQLTYGGWFASSFHTMDLTNSSHNETGWDLEPFAGTWDPLLQCCNACTWTHLSSSNKIQRNWLKITACIWGKFWTQKIQRDQKAHLPLLKSLEPKQGVGNKSTVLSCPLHTTPPEGWAGHLSHPLARPLDTPLPSPHIRNKLAPPWGASKQKNCCLFSLPPAAAGAAVKPCLNFLSGIWSISIDWGRPGTLVGNNNTENTKGSWWFLAPLLFLNEKVNLWCCPAALWETSKIVWFSKTSEQFSYLKFGAWICRSQYKKLSNRQDGRINHMCLTKKLL